MKERLNFLISCRKEDVMPKFIANSVSTVSKIFRNNYTVEKKKQAFCRQLLNEAIKETHRTLAFLHREYRRLAQMRSEYMHPMTSWTEGRAVNIYWETVMTCRQRLTKKYRDLLAKRDSKNKQLEQLCTPDLDRLKNMSNKVIGESLQTLLAKGPTFALTQQVSQNVLHKTEIGVERACHALRWKIHIERTNQQRRDRIQQNQGYQRPNGAQAQR